MHSIVCGLFVTRWNQMYLGFPGELIGLYTGGWKLMVHVQTGCFALHYNLNTLEINRIHFQL
jgi:hypothetical protein